MFDFFDPAAGLIIREGSLPHWYQPGVTYFITFRTEDSVPQSLSSHWHQRRDQWLRERNVVLANLEQHPAIAREYHSIFTREFMSYLDRGYGECVLKRPELAKEVAQAIRFFDEERYRVADYVVMPNHVHVMVGLLGATEVEKVCKSWKTFSAREINRLLGRKGRFWQEESFDHLVRSPEMFEYFRRYIAENPRKANLKSGEYLAYSK